MYDRAYWRCVPCGADVQFGAHHVCPSADVVLDITPAPTITGPRTPWSAAEYPAHLVPKE